MLRLLQGDVGSGKTVVALLAAATVVEAGRQAALMAPTEILARQHHKTIAQLAEAAGLSAAILTGRERGRERADILARLASGDLDLLVGTHALFQEEVEFRDLALAIVDEQHRFGVHQRLALAHKGEAVDTPIGFTPTRKAIDTKGLDLSEEALTQLLRVDPAEWVEAVHSQEQFFATFGSRLPSEIREEHETLAHRINDATTPPDLRGRDSGG